MLPSRVVPIVLLCVVISTADLLLPLGVAAGVPYVLPVLLAVWSPRSGFVVVTAAATSVLTLAGLALSPAGGVLWMVLANRALALLAIWSTALVGLKWKSTESRLRKAHDEKDVLLREVYHRVKNNLQLVNSIIHLQLRSGSAATPEQILTDVRNRVATMALVHEALHQSSDLARIDAANYLGQIVARLEQLHANRAEEQVKIHAELESETVDIDTAVPCGLILNEILSNALKYAFPGERRGQIWVRFRREAGSAVLEVADDGIGPPADVPFPNPTSLGFRIVDALSRQLQGTIMIGRDNGTSVRVTFPL